MTRRLIKFPSIEQYRSVVHTVTSRASYVGKDEQGNAVFDSSRELPTLMFEGTVKLHGTNAAVAMDVEGSIWCQSRENFITPEKDNAGFAMFAHRHADTFQRMFDLAVTVTPIKNNDSIVIFGEWCGGNIQKGVAISQLEKMFVVFGIAHVDDENNRSWFTGEQINEIVGLSVTTMSPIYHIYQFNTYFVTIDFARPHDVGQTLSDLTIAVEEECPVGKCLGATAEKGTMIGEGIVWKCVTPGYTDSNYWFKVKGEKHANKNRVKTFVPADVERIDSIAALATQVTPEWRLEQMYQQVFDTLNGGLPDIKRMGEYIKAVIGDVVKEEIDTISVSGFTMKDISGVISKIARDYLITQLSR